MISNFKDAYCYYITQMSFNCKCDKELEVLLDKIDQNKFDNTIQGDKDIKEVIKYVYKSRLYNKKLINEKPSISNGTIVKVIGKSIF